MGLGLGMRPRTLAQLLEADAERHGSAAACRLARGIDQLTNEPDAIAHRAAIGIGSTVVFCEQELMRQIAHAGIDIDDVETGSLGTLRRLALPADEVADIARVHRLRALLRHERDMGGEPRYAGGRQRRQAGDAVHRECPAMPQLDPGQRTMAVNGLCHHRMSPDVGIVPQRGIGKRAVVGAWMDRAGSGAHHAPAALCLGGAKRSPGFRIGVGHARRMGYRIETVGRPLRADPHRLEQDVVPRIPRHCHVRRHC
jgi:hypothetical protein